MKIRFGKLEPWILLLGSFTLFFGGYSPKLINFLKIIKDSPKWDLHLAAISQLMLIYSVLFFLLCCYSLFLGSSDDFILLKFWIEIQKVFKNIKNIKLKIRPLNTWIQADHFWLMVILLMGILIRVDYLQDPIRADEAYSVIKYVDADLSKLFYYDMPNNHVLHNIFVKISTTILGVNLASVRLPALISGLCVILLTYHFSRLLGQSGLFASLAISIYPYLIFFSINSRGYSLLICLSIWLVIYGIGFAKRGPSFRGSLNLSIISALGMLTMPSMLFMIGGAVIWMLIFLKSSGYSFKIICSEYLIPYGMFTGLLTVLFYTPVIFHTNGAENLIMNRTVLRDPWQKFLAELPFHLKGTYVDFVRDIHPVTIIIVGMLCIFGLVYLRSGKGTRTLLYLIPSLVGGSLVILLAFSKIPFPRTWIFLIPFFIILADAGFSFLIDHLSNLTRIIFISGFMLGGFFIFYNLIKTDSISEYRDTGYFPEAEMAAHYLKENTTEDDRVFFGAPTTWPTHYYMIRNEVPTKFYDIKGFSYRNVYYIVQKSEYSILQMTEDPVRLVFEHKDLLVYQLVK